MKQSASSLVFSSLVIAAISLLSGCMPRGETKTLDELLASGKGKYEATLNATKNLSPEVNKSLDALTTQLASLLSSENAGKGVVNASAEIAATLESLTMKAGYTSRAGLGSLAKQFRSFEEASDAKRTTAKAKLLVYRTYETVASEVATTGFKL